MLYIPDEFFKEEIRDDFLISEMMKRTWATQLSILDSLKKLLNKYGLKYFADYGTLLGAVRHSGYIPWDDDLDISMLRKDFMILLEHADEIEDGLVIRSLYNSETYMNFNAVVTHKADTLKWDAERTNKYYGCPFICYLDIFPWDYVPRDEEVFKVQTQMFGMAYRLMYRLRNIEKTRFDGRIVSFNELRRKEYARHKEIRDFIQDCDMLQQILGKYLKHITINPDKNLRQQLCIAADTIAQMCSEEDADSVEYFPRFRRTAPVLPRRRKEWQETTVELPFEFGSIMVPQEYTKVLESKYGKNFMKPRLFNGAHGYPFYRDEVTVLIGGDTGELLPDIPLRDPSVEAIPEEIRQFLLKDDGVLKKIVLYGLSATDIINRGTKGLERVLSYLRNVDDDTVVFVFVPSGLPEFMIKCHLEIYDNYCRLLDDIGAMDNVILYDRPTTDMLWVLISFCDEYYGDECRLADICRKYDVPVEIQGY